MRMTQKVVDRQGAIREPNLTVLVTEISKNFTKSSVTKRDPPKGVRLYQPFLSVACGA